jgi:hypothetical protein
LQRAGLKKLSIQQIRNFKIRFNRKQCVSGSVYSFPQEQNSCKPKPDVPKLTKSSNKRYSLSEANNEAIKMERLMRETNNYSPSYWLNKVKNLPCDEESKKNVANIVAGIMNPPNPPNFLEFISSQVVVKNPEVRVLETIERNLDDLQGILAHSASLKQVLEMKGLVRQIRNVAYNERVRSASKRALSAKTSASSVAKTSRS